MAMIDEWRRLIEQASQPGGAPPLPNLLSDVLPPLLIHPVDLRPPPILPLPVRRPGRPLPEASPSDNAPRIEYRRVALPLRPLTDDERDALAAAQVDMRRVILAVYRQRYMGLIERQEDDHGA